MTNRSSTDKYYGLWRLLAQTRHAIFKVRDRELRQFGISAWQSSFLFAIVSLGDKATLNLISQRLLREIHSVSEFLSRLERDGMVLKVRDLGRKNLIRVVLTEKGREAFGKSVKRKSIHKIWSCLSEEECKQLESYLLRLRAQALKITGIDQDIPF